jgi:hypothetical protein
VTGGRPAPAGGRRGLRLAAAIIVAGTAAAGCAARSGWGYTEEPGVPATVTEAGGGRFSGTLVSYETGSFVFDRSLLKGEGLEVVRKDGIGYVYVDGVVSGTAVEVRTVDVLTRQRIPAKDVMDLDVKVRGYLGWGSAIAGVLTYFLVQILEGLEY